MDAIATNSTLNPLEQAWTYMLSNYSEHTILVFFTFFIHEFVYFARWIPFYICDHIPALRKYKIQEDKHTTNDQIWKCVRGLIFSHVCIQLPFMMAFHQAAAMLGLRIGLPLPPVWKVACHCFAFLVVEDTWEYWGHRALHWGPFYKHIHKQHHEYQAPFGIVGEYAHPVETFVLGIGTALGPILFAHDLHLITLWCWLCIRLFQVIDAHSGYDFPWSLRNWVPFWAGADFHDHHHQVFLGNYASSFRWWDWMCGTDARYQAYKLELAEKAKKEKAM